MVVLSSAALSATVHPSALLASTLRMGAIRGPCGPNAPAGAVRATLRPCHRITASLTSSRTVAGLTARRLSTTPWSVTNSRKVGTVHLSLQAVARTALAGPTTFDHSLLAHLSD